MPDKLTICPFQSPPAVVAILHKSCPLWLWQCNLIPPYILIFSTCDFLGLVFHTLGRVCGFITMFFYLWNNKIINLYNAAQKDYHCDNVLFDKSISVFVNCIIFHEVNTLSELQNFCRNKKNVMYMLYVYLSKMLKILCIILWNLILCKSTIKLSTFNKLKLYYFDIKYTMSCIRIRMQNIIIFWQILQEIHFKIKCLLPWNLKYWKQIEHFRYMYNTG